MKYLLQALGFIVGPCLIISCQNPLEQNNNFAGDFSITPVKIVSYEVETLTTRQMAGGNVNETDKVRAVPVITRDAVKMGIDKDGKTELFIEKKKPGQRLLPADEIPESSLPEVTYSHITNGVGRFYDSNRRLLYTAPVEETAVDPALLYIRAGAKPNYRQNFDEARAAGAVVTDLGNGVFSTRMTKRMLDGDSGAAYRQNNTADNSYNVTILDTLRGVAVATAIFNFQDKPLFAMYYNYRENADGGFTLNATQQQIYDIDPATQEEVVIQVNSIYENLTLTEN